VPGFSFSTFAVMISEKLRRVENLHIIFWLVKDTCWCMLSHTLGVIMIIPTFLIALFIVIKTRKMPSEFAHNLAVLFWISANSTWMCGEFFCNDCTRGPALVLFSAGITSLVVYYSWAFYKRFLMKKTESDASSM